MLTTSFLSHTEDLAVGITGMRTVEPGYRESATSWEELLFGLRDRGLSVAPELVIADGALGFWAARNEIYPATQINQKF